MSTSAASASRKVDEFAADHPHVVQAARVGWFAKGAVYVLVGVLAFVVVSRSSGWSTSSSSNTEASPTGAMRAIADTSGGPALLGAMALGMILYAAWRLTEAMLPGRRGASGWITRVGYVVSALIYATLATVAVSLALHRSQQPNGNTQVTDISTRLMGHAAGRWIVGIVGVIVAAAGAYHVVNGARRRATKDVELYRMSSARRSATKVLGAVGEIGRGIGIGLVGFFLIRAAVKYDPRQATGLDGALRRVATATWGPPLVVVVALGFIAYGAFCLVSFDRQRLEGP